MGTQQSKSEEKKQSLRNKNHVHCRFDPNGKLPVLSTKEIELLKETWLLVKGDIAKVGVITFIRYVERSRKTLLLNVICLFEIFYICIV